MSSRVTVRKIRSRKDVTCVTNTAFGLQTNRLAAKWLACYRPTANEYTKRTDECHEKNRKMTTERDKIELRAYATTPNRTQKGQKTRIWCVNTGARPVRTAHAALAETHTDSARITPCFTSQDSYHETRFEFFRVKFPGRLHREIKSYLLPYLVGCQQWRTFLAPNPEQTVPFGRQ